MQTKAQIKAKIQPILAAWHKEITDAIRYTSASYDEISKMAGCTNIYIHRLAAKHGIRRVADKPAAKAEEVSNV